MVKVMQRNNKMCFFFQLEGSCRTSTFTSHITTFQPEVSLFCFSIVWRWNFVIWRGGSLIREHFQNRIFISGWVWYRAFRHLVPDISKTIVPSTSKSSSAITILLGLVWPWWSWHDDPWQCWWLVTEWHSPVFLKTWIFSSTAVTILNVAVSNWMQWFSKSDSVLQK
jgi:hypothetical protein